ncbi:MAG: hypothetical protein IBX67_06545 [Dehalococcoidia bacterium]|nr:hypothetical protein [Dehalococcoidia bacterium]
MPVYDFYSKRKKQQEQAAQPDVYKYDSIPEPLRIQIIHIWNTAIGPWREGSYRYRDLPPNTVWTAIHDALCREFGVLRLARGDTPFIRCCTFLLEESNIDNVLSLIEASFNMIDNVCSKLPYDQKSDAGVSQDSGDAIDELNTRFREHRVGYQYAHGTIIRIDSQYIHNQVVLPAISLLQQPGFEGASQEFWDAHRHYRERNNKEAISNALKAFESTMKSICLLMNWDFPGNATARPLIDICIAEGLIPKPLQGHFGSLRATLENGLPTISNRLARHGQGQETVAVPEHYAAYALHLAAANIVFLVEAHMAIKR